jgi:hypothetical protein
LFSVDVDRIADFGFSHIHLFNVPVEVILGTIFLYNLLGFASIVGISATILFLPVNHFTGKKYAGVQDRLMLARDQRGMQTTQSTTSNYYITI